MPAAITSNVTASQTGSRIPPRHPLVGPDDTLAGHRAAKWMREVAPNATVAARNNSVLGLVLCGEVRRRQSGALPIALGACQSPGSGKSVLLGPTAELPQQLAVIHCAASRRPSHAARGGSSSSSSLSRSAKPRSKPDSDGLDQTWITIAQACACNLFRPDDLTPLRSSGACQREYPFHFQ